MGTDAGALLKMLEAYKYKVFEFAGFGRRGVRAVEPAKLLTAHPLGDRESQTNLMLLRGGREPPK